MRFCPRTRAYVHRPTKEGLSKPEIIRWVKPSLAREADHALVADLEASTPLDDRYNHPPVDG